MGNFIVFVLIPLVLIGSPLDSHEADAMMLVVIALWTVRCFGRMVGEYRVARVSHLAPVPAEQISFPPGFVVRAKELRKLLAGKTIQRRTRTPSQRSDDGA